MRSVCKNINNKVNNVVILESCVDELLIVANLTNMSREDIISYRHKLYMAASNSIFDIDMMDKLLSKIDEVDNLI